jgi:hypothetical protein
MNPANVAQCTRARSLHRKAYHNHRQFKKRSAWKARAQGQCSVAFVVETLMIAAILYLVKYYYQWKRCWLVSRRCWRALWGVIRAALQPELPVSAMLSVVQPPPRRSQFLFSLVFQLYVFKQQEPLPLHPLQRDTQLSFVYIDRRCPVPKKFTSFKYILFYQDVRRPFVCALKRPFCWHLHASFVMLTWPAWTQFGVRFADHR